VAAIGEAALLHDVGLLAMSPAYHRAPGPLSLEQRVDLWRHPVIGEQQLARREAPRSAQLLVRWHHEWWNGSGYPDGLAFEDIPIGARILRAVDLFSALVCDRPYRSGHSLTDALERLRASSGIECDPYVIKALLAVLEELKETAVEIVNREAQPPIPQTAVPEFPVSFPENAALPPHEQPAEVTAPTPATDDQVLSALLNIPLSARSQPQSQPAAEAWPNWSRTRYNAKSCLGFDASVLRQIDFKSIAVALSGGSRLDWYLRAWGKTVYSNDPRQWAAALTRATIEGEESLNDEHLAALLQDVYVPGVALLNAALRRWFAETDAWWLDNLRRNTETLPESLQARALALGIKTGDYALSFSKHTRELKRPLTTVFLELNSRLIALPPRNPKSRAFNLPVDDFVRTVHADLLFISLPPPHAEVAGSADRARWREAWVSGNDAGDGSDGSAIPQSKQSYLEWLDRLLGLSAHIGKWAIEYQDIGLVSAREVTDLIRSRRPIRESYAKDVTELAGGLRNYVILAEPQR
jgi:HD domain